MLSTKKKKKKKEIVIQKGSDMISDMGSNFACHDLFSSCRRSCKVYQNGGLHIGSSRVIDQQKCRHNCNGEVIIRINRPINNRCFGIIKHFDKYSNKHTIMFENGGVEYLDMSKEDWEHVRLLCCSWWSKIASN